MNVAFNVEMPQTGDNNALIAALREKDEALREFQHRAKNSLQLVISLLKLQVTRIRDPEARAAYEQTLQRIDALAILYRQMHETGSAAAQVSLDQYLDELAKGVMDHSESHADVLPITVMAEPVVVSLYTAMPLGLLISELLTTSHTHAFPPGGGEARWVKMEAAKVSESRAEIILLDNGRSMPPGLDPEFDASMLLVDALADQLGAELTRSNGGGGTKITINFPV